MIKKISQLGLVSFALFSAIQIPSVANNTSVQTANQEATVSGTNNQVNQTINQTIINHPGLGSVNRNNKKATTNNRRSSPRRNVQNRRNRYEDCDSKWDD